MKLNDIMDSHQHWVYPSEDNPLTKEKVKEICRGYIGNGNFQNFKEYATMAIEERAGVIIDSKIIYEMFQRREEFTNGKVEEP